MFSHNLVTKISMIVKKLQLFLSEYNNIFEFNQTKIYSKKIKEQLPATLLAECHCGCRIANVPNVIVKTPWLMQRDVLGVLDRCTAPAVYEVTVRNLICSY